MEQMEPTTKLIIETPEGLRYIEAPDRPDLWDCVEAYDELHGTNLYDCPQGSIYPDDGAVQVPPADPDEIRAWFGRA